MNAIYFAGWFIGGWYALWLFYLALMNVERSIEAGTLSQPAYYLAMPILTIGYLIDYAVNAIPASILFLELPRWWTVSQRVQFHIDESDGWRRGLALWMAIHLLNPFSATAHIKIPTASAVF